MQTIYHYCDAAAFISIITSGMLRLTHTRKMNDHSEGLVIERAMLEWLDDAVQQRVFSSEDRETVRLALSERRPELYATCFSRERDSTAQWMNYADRGRGFAIGFDPDLLWHNTLASSNHSEWGEDIFVIPVPAETSPEKRIALTPVLYVDKGRKSAIMSRLITEIRAFMKHSAIDGVVGACAFYGAISKDVSFKHEQEVRLVYRPGIIPAPPRSGRPPHIIGPLSPLQWRAGAYGVTPYFDFRVPVEAIKEVWIGPANPEHKDHSARHLLENLLRFHGMSDVALAESQSPYR